MKRCSICQRVYSENVQFCLTDNNPLTSESPFSGLDSEPETVVGGRQIVVDLSQPNQSYTPNQSSYQGFNPNYNEKFVPPRRLSSAGGASNSNNTLLYAVFGGVILFGILAIGLGAVILYFSYKPSRPTELTLTNLANAEAEKNPKKTKDDNRNTKETNKNDDEDTATPTPKPKPKPTATPNKTESNNDDNNARDKTKKGSYNARVKAKQAMMRTGPSISSKEIGTIDYGEKLRIIRKSGQWYQIICEHGVTGWMHEKNIETTD